MPSSTTPGSSTSISSRQRCRHRPSPNSDRLGTPKIPAIRFAQGVNFVAYTVHTFATAAKLLPPCTDPTGLLADEDFYFQAFNEIGPLLDMATASTGLLCWLDSHLLEWQLASLHAPHLPDADR